MTTAPTALQKPEPYVTPECSVGRTDPTWRHGCPMCQAPGYQHPVLGWMPVSCACPHHTTEVS
ncbi:hypothetical protein [Streptacidiphilus sp. PAMC 29251]